MGYESAEHCIKSLKERNQLGIEVDYEQQKESERIGEINLRKVQQKLRTNNEEYKRRVLVLMNA